MQDKDNKSWIYKLKLLYSDAQEFGNKLCFVNSESKVYVMEHTGKVSERVGVELTHLVKGNGPNGLRYAFVNDLKNKKYSIITLDGEEIKGEELECIYGRIKHIEVTYDDGRYAAVKINHSYGLGKQDGNTSALIDYGLHGINNNILNGAIEHYARGCVLNGRTEASHKIKFYAHKVFGGDDALLCIDSVIANKRKFDRIVHVSDILDSEGNYGLILVQTRRNAGKDVFVTFKDGSVVEYLGCDVEYIREVSKEHDEKKVAIIKEISSGNCVAKYEVGDGNSYYL